MSNYNEPDGADDNRNDETSGLGFGTELYGPESRWTVVPSDNPMPRNFENAVGPDAYAYDPKSAWMKPPKGRPSERIVVGMNPGSHECYKQAKERMALCMSMLDQVSESLKVFRPSESLFNLDQMVCYDTEDADGNKVQVSNDEPVEVDLVLSGGGLKGYFMAGGSYVLQKEFEKRNMKIARIAGASAGAWAGLFMLSNITTDIWIESYFANAIRPGSTLLEAYKELWPYIGAILEPDTYKKMSGRLFVSVTEIGWGGFTNRIISEFHSNEDLFNCCVASSSIPYMSIPGWYTNLRGVSVLDGGITNNVPVFPDGKRRQLVCRLYEVEYPFRQMLNPIDTCIETLVLRGALLMSRFLQGEPTDSINWLEREDKEADLPQRSNRAVRAAILPIVLGGYILSRGTGLSTILRELFSKHASPLLSVPFNRAAALAGTSSISYISTTILAGVVDLLRGFQFLL